MGKRIVYFLVVVLAVLHQDFWYWDDTTLVFDFLPAGLAYHAVYSLVAAGAWWLVLKYAWPEDAEAFAEGGDQDEVSE